MYNLLISNLITRFPQVKPQALDLLAVYQNNPYCVKDQHSLSQQILRKLFDLPNLHLFSYSLYLPHSTTYALLYRLFDDEAYLCFFSSYQLCLGIICPGMLGHSQLLNIAGYTIDLHELLHAACKANSRPPIDLFENANLRSLAHGLTGSYGHYIWNEVVSTLSEDCSKNCISIQFSTPYDYLRMFNYVSANSCLVSISKKRSQKRI